MKESTFNMEVSLIENFGNCSVPTDAGIGSEWQIFFVKIRPARKLPGLLVYYHLQTMLAFAAG